MDVHGPRLRFGAFTLEPGRRRLLRDGQAVPLRAKSFEVLALLAASAGRIVGKDDIVSAVWAGRPASDESIARCISDVRAALRDDDHDLIRTVPTRGYVLACPIATDQGPASVATRVDADIPSVVVRPFRGLGPDADMAVLAATVTEDVQSALAGVGEFRVLCGLPFEDGDAAMPPPVQARYQLEGSVRRLGQRLRITAGLFEASTRELLWSRHFDVAEEELPAAQDAIVAGIAGQLGTELVASEFARIRRIPPASLDARQHVVLAMHHASRQSDADTASALDCLDRALATDGAYARALGMKAWLLVFRAFQGWAAMGPSLEAALALTAEARASDNRELWGCLAAAMVNFALRDPEASRDALHEALRLNPSSVHAHGLLGIAHAFAGDGESGLAAIDRAIGLSPREPFLVDFDLYHAFAHVQRRDAGEGLRAGERAHRRRPGHVYPLILAACCAGHAGRAPQGLALVERLLALMPVASAGWIEATAPYVREADRAWLVDGLQRVGLK